jgi:hypothetical protein
MLDVGTRKNEHNPSLLLVEKHKYTFFFWHIIVLSTSIFMTVRQIEFCQELTSGQGGMLNYGF